MRGGSWVVEGRRTGVCWVSQAGFEEEEGGVWRGFGEGYCRNMGNQLCFPVLSRYRVPSCAVCEKEAKQPYNKLSGPQKRTWVFHDGLVYCAKCLITCRIEAFQKNKDSQFQARVAQVVAEKYVRRPRPASGLRKVHSGKAWHKSSSFRAPYVQSPSVTEKLQRITRISTSVGRETDSLRKALNDVAEFESNIHDEEYVDYGDGNEEQESTSVTGRFNDGGEPNGGDFPLWVDEDCLNVYEMRHEFEKNDFFDVAGDMSDISDPCEQETGCCEVGKECDGETSSAGANNATSVVAVGYPLGKESTPVDSDGENNLEDDDEEGSTGSWESYAGLIDNVQEPQAKKSFGNLGRFSFVLDDATEVESVDLSPASSQHFPPISF